MKKSVRNKGILLISVLFAALIFIVFYYVPEEGGTIFERRNLERYIEVVKDNEFDKLQVYVLTLNRNDGTQRKFEVEELGAKSEDVCLILHEFGILTEDWLTKPIEEKRTEKYMVTVSEGQYLAMDHIAEMMNIEKRAELSLRWVSIGVKKKWYHYLLL